MKRISCLLIFAVAANAALFSPALADEPQPPANASELADNTQAHWEVADVNEWIDAMLARLESIDSYTATVAMREREADKLEDYEFAYVKVRQKPKSYYTYWLKSKDHSGSEALFVEGRDEHPHVHLYYVRDEKKLMVPRCFDGWRYHHYSVRLNMEYVARLVRQYLQEHDKNGTSLVRGFKGAKINGRLCTAFEVSQKDGKEPFILRIFADDELQLPVRFELYLLVGKEQKPELQEEYTFLNINPDAKLTDLDFDVSNPKYGFSYRKTAATGEKEASASAKSTAVAEPCDCGRRWLRRRR